MILLQTLPVESVLENTWSTVDEFRNADSIRDFLQSPTIDRFDGLMIRAVKSDNIIETFVWYRERWHDLSSKGKLAQKWPIGDKKFMREYGYPEAWRVCSNPQWLIDVIKHVEMSRMEMFNLADAVFTKCRENDTYEEELQELRKDAIQLCNTFIESREIERLRQAAKQRYIEGNRIFTDSRRAFDYLVYLLSNYHGDHGCMATSMEYSCKLARSPCDVLRRAMPLSRIFKEYFR